MDTRKITFCSLVLVLLLPCPGESQTAENMQPAGNPNPSYSEISREIERLAKDYQIPPIIIQSICWKENKWTHFKKVGNDWKPWPGPTGDFGLMQVTENEAVNFPQYVDWKDNWKTNLKLGVKILLKKWSENGVPDSNKPVLEEWYYPIAWYNGEGPKAYKYVDDVYTLMQNPPGEIAQFCQAVNINSPRLIPGWDVGTITGRGNWYELHQIVAAGGHIHQWNGNIGAALLYEDITPQYASTNGIETQPQEFGIFQHLEKSVPGEEKTQVTKDRFTKVANVSCDELSRLGTATAGVLRKELNSPKMRRLAVMRSLTLAEEAKIVGDLFKGFGGWVTKKYAQWGLVDAKPPEDVVTLSTDDELVIFALSTTASDLASVFFGPVGAAGTAVLSEAAKRVGLLIGKTPINGIGYAELGRPGIGTMVVVYDKNQQVAWVTIDLDDLEGQAKENYGWQNEHLYVYIPFNGQPPRLKMTSGKFGYKVVLKGEPVASQTGVTSDQQISIQNLLQKSVEKPATVAEKTGVVGEPETVTPGLAQPSVLGDFATSLVIDKSGSMSGEKIEKAKKSAYCYVDTCAEGDDLVSLVTFHSRADANIPPVSIAQGRKTLESGILSVGAGGSTNIGSGLAVAHDHLSSCNTKNKVAVLMTDGKHNTGTYKPEVDQFKQSGWPIYTVGFGPDADMQTLEWIALETGGLWSWGEIPDLQGIYTAIKVQAHLGSIDRAYTDFIRPGQTLAYDMPVNPGSKKAGCYVHWQGSSMETTLTSPRGQIINRNNFHQWGRFSEEQTYTFFEIDNPQPGNWQVQIVGHDLPPQGEQINFQSFSYSDVFSNILSFQPAYSNNQKVRVAVKLAEVIDDQLRPMKGAYVNAEIKKPSVHVKNLILGRRTVNLMDIITTISNQTREIELFDDGQHGDVNPGDGIYANTYNDTATNGPYVVSVYVEGHSRGRRFDRIIEESFQVGNIEQNSFTISDFLGLINKKATGSQKQQPKTEEVMRSLLDQLLKK